MEQQQLDGMYMARCLELAANGIGNVAPNPMVGSVVVHGQRIIGEGYHVEYGKSHAEYNAIHSVGDPGLLRDSTLYILLEPCSHFGKTPPCTELIIESGVRRVVVATLDPNPKVMGRGIQALKLAGCQVVVGVMEREAQLLNRRFFTYHTKKRPYVILKWAQTLDGYIDAVREPHAPLEPIWITNTMARTVVHRWRSEEQAIMIGTNTVLRDNPRLDVRLWGGASPLRVVMDRKLRIPQGAHVYNGAIPTLVFIGNNASASQRKPLFAAIPNLELLTIDFAKGPEAQVLRELYSRGIQSIIIEGGAMLINSFVECGLWDEARVFIGDLFFNGGVPAPRVSGRPHSHDSIGTSRLITYFNAQGAISA